MNEQEKEDGEHRRADPPLDERADGEPGDGAGGSEDPAAGADAGESAGEDAGKGGVAGSWFSGGGGNIPLSVVYSFPLSTSFWHSSEFGTEKEIPHDGIRVGEIEAWRTWWVEEGFLRSMVTRTWWMPEKTLEGPNMDAMMDPSGVSSASFGFTWYGIPAGIHAWKGFGHALTYAIEAKSWQDYGGLGMNYPEDRQIVVGRVHLWGDIVEHADGYRAQFARPISFDEILNGGWWPTRRLAKLRRKYNLG